MASDIADRNNNDVSAFFDIERYGHDISDCHDSSDSSYQRWTSEVCDSLRGQPSAIADRDVSFDSLGSFESPPSYLSPTITTTYHSPPTSHSIYNTSTTPSQPLAASTTYPSTRSFPSPSTDNAEVYHDAWPTQWKSNTCELCDKSFDGTNQLIKHLVEKHYDNPSYCGRLACNNTKPWKERELKRHLDKSKAHEGPESRRFHCRCKKTFPRRDQFRNHLKTFTCKGDDLLACCCGFTFDSRLAGNNMHDFEAHYNVCDLKRKGRPKKQSNRNQ